MATDPSIVDLSGRVVVVAGAGGGGIGTAVTRLAARAGATIVAADFSKESLDKHIEPLISEGLSISPVVADVLKEEGVATIMKAARGARGDLYGLVTIIGG